MASFNKVILIGNLTREPELKFLPKGTAICNISMAVNRRWKNEVGEEKEDVYFADCKSFGKQAEVLAQYVKKGHPLMIEGRLSREEWEDKQTGAKRNATRIIIEQFQFLRGKDDGGDPSQRRQPAATAAAPAAKPDLDDDDVPF
jgi:single-strand DNA-binding protein